VGSVSVGFVGLIGVTLGSLVLFVTRVFRYSTLGSDGGVVGNAWLSAGFGRGAGAARCSSFAILVIAF
jgi:hypothetical protein